MQLPSIRLLTYNVHKGFSTGNVRFVLPEMREMLERTHADIVFLQEIQGEHRRRRRRVERWPSASQFEYLADRLWPHHAYGKNAIYRLGHHGNAILSQHPFHSWENVNVSRHRRASRSILHGIIRLPPLGVPLHTICIHFGLFEFERRAQVQALLRRIDSHVPHHEPMIVAGDFNDWRGQFERYLHDELELDEVFRVLGGRHAPSFPAWFPVFPMDRIYFRGLVPVSCRSLSEESGHRLSDHLPLFAEFRLAPE